MRPNTGGNYGGAMTDARWFIVVMAIGLVLTVGTGIASCALGHTSKSDVATPTPTP